MAIPAMINAVIFDLDGLLADTEKLHCQAYRDALAAHGAGLSVAEYAEHWVRFGRGITEWIHDHQLGLDPLEVRAEKTRRYHDLLKSSLRPMAGALELVTAMQGKKRLALASSSYRDAVDGVLRGLAIADRFEVIVSGLDVPHVKPAPDLFLRAASLLGVNANECVVLEDAEKGIIAAHAAGMRSIAVPNDYTRHHDFSKATQVCASLTEISPASLDALAAVSHPPPPAH